jgi:uncharacterized protein
MNVYLDASALVKRYVAEPGSPEVAGLIAAADSLVTAVISRAEVSAALGKAVRLKVLSQKNAAMARQAFQAEWNSLGRLPITEMVIARADDLSWELQLRGYDAVHLAVAAVWQETLGRPVTMATFDRQLWLASKVIGLDPWPGSLD